jgi:uncharacterized membrane protein
MNFIKRETTTASSSSRPTRSDCTAVAVGRVLALLAASAGTAAAQTTTFRGVGLSPSAMTAVSGDGTVAVGYTGGDSAPIGFLLRLNETTATALTNSAGTSLNRSVPIGIRFDGGTIVGYQSTNNSFGGRATFWVDPATPQLNGVPTSVMWSCADNGSTIVGYENTTGNADGYRAQVWAWSSGQSSYAQSELPSLRSSVNSIGSVARSVSANGSVAVGQSWPSTTTVGSPPTGWQACYWRAGTSGYSVNPLGYLSGNTTADSVAVSADGRFAVGYSGNGGVNTQACYWDLSSTGVPAAGTLSLAPGSTRVARAIGSRVAAPSGIENYIIGGSYEPSPGNVAAFIWENQSTQGAIDNVKFRDLKTYLSGLGVNLTGWTLTEVTGISRNGRVLVGNGRRDLGGTTVDEGWIVTLPATRACNPADIADNASNPGFDGCVDNGDFSLFIGQYFNPTVQAGCNGATVPCCASDIASNLSIPGPDGLLDNGDFSLFISSFFGADCAGTCIP